MDPIVHLGPDRRAGGFRLGSGFCPKQNNAHHQELTAVATIGAVFFANRLRAAWQHERERRLRLEATRTRTVEWQQEEHELLLRVNQAIKRQFEKWDLSSSETEVALHLLKGLSMKEIADLRGSTLGTIKQQSHVLYQKAGLKGRAELSAFFLGSLLPEDLAGVDSPPSSQP